MNGATSTSIVGLASNGLNAILHRLKQNLALYVTKTFVKRKKFRNVLECPLKIVIMLYCKNNMIPPRYRPDGFLLSHLAFCMRTLGKSDSKGLIEWDFPTKSNTQLL